MNASINGRVKWGTLRNKLVSLNPPAPPKDLRCVDANVGSAQESDDPL